MKRKYDPEDIESLMMHKSFDELYEEEKRFVLEHTAGAEEYESMRQTLLSIQESTRNDKRIAPRKGMKADLMAEFANEKKKPWTIWLNQLLPFVSEKNRQPFGLAFAALLPLLVVGGLWYFSPDDGKTLAENRDLKTEREVSKEEDQAPAPNAEKRENAPTEKVEPNEGTNNAIDAVEDLANIENEVPVAEPTDMVTADYEAISNSDATFDMEILEEAYDAASDVVIQKNFEQPSVAEPEFFGPDVEEAEATPAGIQSRAQADFQHNVEIEISSDASVKAVLSKKTANMRSEASPTSLSAKEQGIDFDALFTAL